MKEHIEVEIVGPDMMECPKCRVEQEDLDGFGFWYCPSCKYCEHASYTGGVCDTCGIVDVVKRAQAEIDKWRKKNQATKPRTVYKIDYEKRNRERLRKKGVENEI